MKLASLTMIEMINTIRGKSSGILARYGFANCPRAAPRGLARVAIAVALVRPWSVNQLSLNLLGVERQKGWAKPMTIWPNMTTP